MTLVAFPCAPGPLSSLMNRRNIAKHCKHSRTFRSWRIPFMSCAQHPKYSRIMSCAQHPKLPIFVECIIESMTQTSGLCRAHSSSFTVRPRVEQGTSWASDTDGKGHCRGRSGSTDFVPGRNWTEIFDFHVRTWTEPNYAWKGPTQVRRSRISEHSRWAI